MHSKARERISNSYVRISILTISVFLMLIFPTCGLKRPKEEIGPLRDVMARFERGAIAGERAVLDSVYTTKKAIKDSLISALLLGISDIKLKGSVTGGEVKNLQFTRRRFSVVEGKDSATVELFLGGENLKAEDTLEVFLKKRRGSWRVVGQTLR